MSRQALAATLSTTTTPTTLTDLMAGVTDGSGPSVGFKGQMLIGGATVTVTTPATPSGDSPALATSTSVPIDGVDLKQFTVSGAGGKVTLIGVIDPGWI